jgi:hypothetical protein
MRDAFGRMFEAVGYTTRRITWLDTGSQNEAAREWTLQSGSCQLWSLLRDWW